MSVSETLTDRRHKMAELEHLRIFFIRWCEFHRLCAMNEREALERAAEALHSQAKLLREFYA
jgi:hypothetical protein